MPKKKQEEEVKGSEGQTDVKPEEVEKAEASEAAVGKLIETKGKFRLFKTSEGYKILDDYNRLISRGNDLDDGIKMLNGLTRR